MDNKATQQRPLRKPADKHSIYTIKSPFAQSTPIFYFKLPVELRDGDK